MDATSRHALRGVFAASLTPITADDEPDLDRFVEHSRWLLDHGCDGLGILGSTGEANSFSLAQRRAVIERAVRDIDADKLLVGTGSCALADAIALTRDCVAAGVHHVLVLPPFYYRPVSDDGVFAYFAKLIERVAEPRLKVFLYNFPQLTGFTFSHDLIGRLLDAYPDTVSGLKDSSGDRDNMLSLCRTFPTFATFAGSEAFLLDVLRAGGAGCITASANVTCAECAAVCAAWQSDEADALQERLTAVRNTIQAYPPVTANRALTALRTGDASWKRTMPPHVALTDAQTADLVAALQALDYPVGPSATANAAE